VRTRATNPTLQGSREESRFRTRRTRLLYRFE
jgi:hypothetical protein